MDNLVQKIQLPKIIDQRGSLSFLESNNHIPFKIKSTHLIMNSPSLLKNGDLIINKGKEFLVVLSGFLKIRIKYGKIEKTFDLDKPNIGLYVPSISEKSFIDFSPNLILLVLHADELKK